MEAQSPTKGEVPHLSHPEHSVSLTSAPEVYICDACKEHGVGERYTCNSCHLNIHEFCAKAGPSISHPSHAQHHLIFHARQTVAFPKPRCGVCGEFIQRYAFALWCDRCHFSIHPCCAHLPQELEFVAHSEHTLKLMAKSAENDGSYMCNACGKKGSGWVYCCAECGFYVHALCAKAVVYGLQGVDVNVASKPRTVRRASRFGGHRFIGGVVESLGHQFFNGAMEGFTNTVGGSVFDRISSTFAGFMHPSEEQGEQAEGNMGPSDEQGQQEEEEEEEENDAEV